MGHYKQHKEEEIYQTFPLAIRELAQNNAAVYHIMRLHMAQEILTKEEALCQMVVALNKDWKRENERYMEMLLNASRSVSFIHKP